MRFIKTYENHSRNSKVIDVSDINYMCKDTEYFDKKSKEICDEYKKTGIITDDILEVYVVLEIETWGDMVDGVIEFIYDWGNKEFTIIKGKYVRNQEDSPAKIISIEHAEIAISQSTINTLTLNFAGKNAKISIIIELIQEAYLLIKKLNVINN
jgi:hypothetical protein